LSGYATETWVSGKLNDILGINASGVAELVTILSDNDTATGILSAIANKANRSELFSGSYTDLTDKPTIPAAAADGTFSIKTKVGSNSSVIIADFTAN